MIAKQLRKVEFTEPQIRELKQNRKLILICDGYDESQQTHNLYTSNRINLPGEWSAKMVISCRNDHIGADYRDRFQPGDRNSRSDTSLFQEAVIMPFSLGQVQDYIDQYVFVHRPPWKAEDYKKALELVPNLKDLVKNPFLMSLSLEVLPRMVDPRQDMSANRATRVVLYDRFIEHWLERGKKRLGEKNLSPQARAAFESLSDEGFTENGLDYMKRLSVAIYRKQNGQPIVRYIRSKDEGSWKDAFFGRGDEKQLLRESCPLTRTGSQHRFIHRSLLEYGLALAVFDPQDWKENASQELTCTRRRSVDSTSSFENVHTKEETDLVGHEPDLNSPLAWRSFAQEPSVIQFLGERVQQEQSLKRQLLEYIEHSKADRKWRIAAANAITILVHAGVQFNDADLRSVRIPGADISHGVFESARMQGADLRHVNFHCAWLQHANLSGSQMTSVRFGEMPFLDQENEVSAMAYTQDGMSLAVGHVSGRMNVYSTANWERQWTQTDHSNLISGLSHSPKGSQIASCSHDKTVRLWDVRTGTCCHVLTGHASVVNCVVYSPHGDRVASASDDQTVLLWNTDTGDCCHILIGHTHDALCVVYSPRVDQLASSSADSTVRLWDVTRGGCSNVLRGHGKTVCSVVYSPHGNQVATGSHDKTVRLWDVDTGTCLRTLSGHGDWVTKVAFSPKGAQIASVGRGKTVNLWDVVTGVRQHILYGHTDNVNAVTYSPRGDQFASACDDYSVRLWDPETGECRKTLSGHTLQVKFVIYSPKGNQIASGSVDNTVRLWGVEIGSSRHVSDGHKARVRSVKFSPRGNRVVSGDSHGTIRLWNAETGVCIHTLSGHSSGINCLAFTPEGDQVVSSSDDNTVRIWDAGTGECRRTMDSPTKNVGSVVYPPNGHQHASSKMDNAVRHWGIGKKVHSNSRVPSVDNDRAWSVAFSAHGDQTVSDSNDKIVRIWNAEIGELPRILVENESAFTVMYSLKSNQLAPARDDKTPKLWDIKAGTLLQTSSSLDDYLAAIAYSPQGNQLASSGHDKSVRLWNMETGECSHILIGHSDLVEIISYSPQGDLIATASKDMTVRLWDTTLGQCRGIIQVFQDRVKGINGIAWSESPKFNYLVAGCEDGSVRMWQVMTKDRDHRDIHLRWRTTTAELNVKGMCIKDVRELSKLNRHLLGQRGAVIEPAHPFHKAGENPSSTVKAAFEMDRVSTDASGE
ncbi:MAG: WD40-repeat-containing domain protein [Benniella sp.]|nr:MAG: WD40-repeat-containing domain protein [Benniella sp.]